MTSEDVRRNITESAEELRNLHAEVHRTHKLRNLSSEALNAWHVAAEVFRTRYDQLAFPGGESQMLTRLKENDPETVEAAICFLEVRPYFFRSGYMYKDLIRHCMHLDLVGEQKSRFDAIIHAYESWRVQRVKRD